MNYRIAREVAIHLYSMQVAAAQERVRREDPLEYNLSASACSRIADLALGAACIFADAYDRSTIGKAEESDRPKA